MTKQYYLREGEATAVDTKTGLTTAGSETAPGALNVPKGATKLLGILVAAMANFAAVGAYSAFIRLEGKGLPGGPYVLSVGAGGGNIATGMSAAVPAKYLKLDLPVTEGNEIQIFGEMTGVDVGAVSFGVCPIFEVSG